MCPPPPPSCSRGREALARREFLVLEDERITYDAFARAVAVLAADLHARGLRKGDRVALVMRNLPEWPVVLMAALLAGGHRGAAECLVDRHRAGLWHPGFRRALCLCRWRAPGAAGRPAAVGGAGVRHALRTTPVYALEDIIGAPAHWHALPDAPHAGRGARSRKTMPPSSIPPAPAARPRAPWARTATSPPTSSPSLSRRRAMRCAAGERTARAQPSRAPRWSPCRSSMSSAALSMLLPTMAAGGKLVLMRKFDAREAARPDRRPSASPPPAACRPWRWRCWNRRRRTTCPRWSW